MERDKLLHFIVCETIVMVIAIACRFAGLGNFSYAVAFVVALCAGVGKEIYDKKKTGLFDHLDIVFDFLGAFFGLVLVYLAGMM